jgi:glutathione synthase/RimK-type ligase-like ATP-grasp enzyme
MIITRYSHLTQVYRELGPGDVFIGQIPRSHLKPVLLTDLAARGVHLLPSATAQMLSASKTAQAFVLKPWMLPHTRVITRRKDLLDAVADYHRHGIAAVVSKQEHMHCGHGVRKWGDLDTLYSCLSLDERHYPFVLQPFREIAADVRVVIVGDYREAYARTNPDGFRMNLSAGGSSHPYPLDEHLTQLCRTVMARAQMPYSHIDLLLTGQGDVYLSEISLNGGMHGARASQDELAKMKQAHLMALTEHLPVPTANGGSSAPVQMPLS